MLHGVMWARQLYLQTVQRANNLCICVWCALIEMQCILIGGGGVVTKGEESLAKSEDGVNRKWGKGRG